MKTLTAAQRAEALRAARGERRLTPGVRCGIRYLSTSARPVAPVVARPAIAAQSVVVPAVLESSDEPTSVEVPPAMIRVWARRVGLACPTRGRIPKAVRTAYEQAMAYLAQRAAARAAVTS